MSSKMERLVGELLARMHEGSVAGFRDALAAAGREARRADGGALTAAVETIAPLVPGMGGVFAKTAVLAGACVEWGGSPVALAPVLPARAAEALQLWSLVPGVWEAAMPGRPLPEPADITMAELMRVFAEEGARHGYPREAMERVAMSWFDLDDWLRAIITTLARRDFRDAVSAEDMEKLRSAASEAAERSELAHWVHGLASVLDDEPLIVLDSGTGRGFALTMSGVGDNFQLHTLLADRLIGDPAEGLLPGERPDPAWVRAAATGDPGLGPDNPVMRRFRLFDAQGAYVFPEGVPADIPAVDGVRVIVLHPPKGRFGWANGRVYEHMESALVLDRPLDPRESALWLSRTLPARETDLMGANPAQRA